MEKQLQVNESTIFYNVYGDGRPVLLIHGFGETGSVWEKQVQFLKDRYLLLVPDLPGSGASEPVADMSIEGMAEVVKRIWDQESGQVGGNSGRGAAETTKPVIFGHSMGGYITLAFMEKYPGLPAAFGLIHSSPFADNEEKINTRKKGIAFIREHGGFAFLESTSPNLFSPDTKQLKPQLVEGFIAGLKGFSGDSLIRYYEAMIARPDRSNILKETDLTVLFVLGKHDTAIPLEDGLKQTVFPEKSYIHVLTHSGHMGMLEETDKLNQILENFLREY